MQLTGLDADAQRLAWTEHMLLTHELVQRPRPHAVRERPQRVTGVGIIGFHAVIFRASRSRLCPAGA